MSSNRQDDDDPTAPLFGLHVVGPRLDAQCSFFHSSSVPHHLDVNPCSAACDSSGRFGTAVASLADDVGVIPRFPRSPPFQYALLHGGDNHLGDLFDDFLWVRHVGT